MGYILTMGAAVALVAFLAPRVRAAWREDRGAAIALAVVFLIVPAILAAIG